MPSPESSTRRRPVPPTKTASQAELRESLISAARQHRDGSNPNGHSDGAQNVTPDRETDKNEAMKNLTLPPGWDLRSEADVAYHTHIAKRMN